MASHFFLALQTIATVCMFLAGKVEETPRPLKDVILVSYEIMHKKDPAATQRIKQKVFFMLIVFDWLICSVTSWCLPSCLVIAILLPPISISLLSIFCSHTLSCCCHLSRSLSFYRTRFFTPLILLHALYKNNQAWLLVTNSFDIIVHKWKTMWVFKYDTWWMILPKY